MWVQLLAFWHNFTVLTASIWEETKAKARTWLGPAPESFYLLTDGRVIPSSHAIPAEITPATFYYDPRTHRIAGAANREPEGRWRRLPYIAGNIRHRTIADIDISDWLGDIRANPVPDIPIKQLLILWSAVNHQYIPLSDGVQISITKSDGETDLITYE
jgi:hypothetical protein